MWEQCQTLGYMLTTLDLISERIWIGSETCDTVNDLMSGDTKDKLDLYGVRDDVSSNAVQSCVLKDFLSTLYINV